MSPSSNQRKLAHGLAILFYWNLDVQGQNVAYSPGTLQMMGNNTQGAVLTAHSASTLLTFIVEGDATGGNSFDAATSDPSVVISLIIPSGTEVTSANAASLGFTFTVIADGSMANVEVPSGVALPGTHTIIQIPAGQPSGTYNIKANAANTTADSGLFATYYSSSSVRAAATTDAPNYSVGSLVILSGLIFDDASPISGATVTATVSAPVSLAGQANLGSFQLVSQQQVNSTLTDYSYSVTLTNTGPAEQSVRAQVASIPSTVTLLNDTVVFGDVAANSSATSQNTITIERNPSQSFDPAALQWNITTPGPETALTLLDSGQYDAATGDGVYTGTFTPTVSGDYIVVLATTGTSLAGNAFSRTAATQFTVTSPLASFTSFTDALQSGGLVVTANVNVQTAGTYNFSIQLLASNQKVIQGLASATLAAGSQQISATFAYSDVFALGVAGPYERVNALLVYTGSAGDLTSDARADAGPTAAYSLASVTPNVYFTGQNTATGVTTGAGPGYDFLQAQIGVYGGGNTCNWTAFLVDQNGNQIDWVQGTVLSNPAFTINANFNGGKIYAAAVNGPYGVNVSVRCGPDVISKSPLFQTPAFTYTQFTPQVSAPTFTPTGGSYTSGQTVTLATATPGAAIRYTTEIIGQQSYTSPTETTGTLYTGPFTVGAGSTIVAAIAYKSGLNDSPVSSVLYTIILGPVVLPVPPSTTLTISSGTPVYSGTTITAAGNNTTVVIGGSASVSFTGTTSITLLPGFSATAPVSGSSPTFQACIGTCSSQ